MFCTWNDEERSFSALTSVVGARGALALPKFLSCTMEDVEALTNVLHFKNDLVLSAE